MLNTLNVLRAICKCLIYMQYTTWVIMRHHPPKFEHKIFFSVILKQQDHMIVHEIQGTSTFKDALGSMQL